MTIASEISRLQGAKSDIRQAIIDKGVDVGASLTLDGYAACINDIQTGSGGYSLNILLVGGGGGGRSRGENAVGGGGGGGQVICLNKIGQESNIYSINIGAGGCPDNDGGITCVCGNCGFNIEAIGGQGCSQCKFCGGRSGGGFIGGGWGDYYGASGGGGGGGAGGNGETPRRCYSGAGGCGLYGYGGGGAGGGPRGGGCGRDGGGNDGSNATGYGGGGGGQACGGVGCGCQGMAEICYPTDGSYGFTTATGGQCCYTCNGYKVHRFTSNGTFTIVS